MTAPRQILPGTTYLITRRCAQRQLLLRPSETTNDLFRYALALAARATGVQIHAACVMSNHHHAVVTDPHARLPEFTRNLHAVVARGVNRTLGRSEALWSSDRCSVIPLEGASVILAAIAYVLANPVVAGLVREGRQWPGLWSPPEAIGGPSVEVRRPEVFFREGGDLPRTVTLDLVVPPGFADAEDFRAQLAEALAAKEAAARQAHAASGFMGRRRVLAQSPWARPRSTEPRSEKKPRFATEDGPSHRAALARLTDFLERYRQAWRAFREGARDVLFPAGTYQLRVMHGVWCEAPA